MATSLIPQPNNQNPDDGNPPSTGTEPQGQQNPQGTQTPNGSAQFIDPRNDPNFQANYYRSQFELAQQELMRLRSQQQQVPNNPPPQPQADYNRLNQEFLESPVAVLEKVFDTRIKQALDSQVAPLNNFVGTLQKKNQYDSIKRSMMIDPRINALFQAYGNAIDNLIETTISNNPNVQITQDLVQQAVVQAIGYGNLQQMLSGNQQQFQGQQNAQIPNTQQSQNPYGNQQQPPYQYNPNNQVTPAYLQNHNPAPFNSGQQQHNFQLTEEERHYMRQYGFDEKNPAEVKLWKDLQTAAPDESDRILDAFYASKKK